jgi:16S rRNA (cytidine1402-2'-O)-methyltransferase
VPALYIISTPIGNLEDISLRALRLLDEVKLIAAEDTRITRHLLKKYNIKTPITSYHEHNKLTKLDYLLNQLTEGDIALVSDAGTPLISDTGYELITSAIQYSIPVIPVPGPSAFLAALVASGLPTDQFIFLGYLPRRKNDRRKLLQSLANETRTITAFEAPHRLLRSLDDMLEILGDRSIAVCRELTKIHEEIFRGRIIQAIEHFKQPKGEFTLILQGKTRTEPEVNGVIEMELRRLHQNGVSARDAVAQLSAKSGISKKRLYQAWLKQTDKGE